MRIKLVIILLMLVSLTQTVASQEYQVRSPDGDTCMHILGQAIMIEQE